MARPERKLALTFQPLTLQRWNDLEKLFGERGACGGCWCMSWRLTHSQFDAQRGRRNKSAFKSLVASGPPPGVLAYFSGEPIGWCAVAPREVHKRFEKSRILA